MSDWTTAAIEECRNELQSMLALSDNEQAFLDGVIDNGEIDASLLDADAGLQQRIGRMPMLNWKAENVKKNAGKT